MSSAEKSSEKSTVTSVGAPDFASSGRRELATAEATREFGAQLGAILRAGEVVILSGALGAGKTTLTQGLAKGMDVRGRVTSPTFTIARVHRARESAQPDLVHVDAYRLLGDTAAPEHAPADPWGELDALDLDTDLETSVVVAEWGAGLVEALTQRYLLVELDRESAVAADPDSHARIVTWAWVEN